MKQLNRRRFLHRAAVGAATLSLPARARSGIQGANDAIRVGVIGLRDRGGDHVQAFAALPGVKVTAVCDCDLQVLASTAERCHGQGAAVEAYADVRKLLESKNVDVVSTATPNHWHSLIVVWACQAGKDVYVEKPVSHNVWEGRQAVEAARKYDRIVQTGTQNRSSRTGIAAAVEWVRDGNLGKINLVRGLCYNRRGSIGQVDGPQPIPPHIDYDLWCGPAPKDPLLRKRLHYDWHWVWPTGNGDLGNQGVHQLDIARWFLGESELSPRVWSVGGRFGYADDATTPNTQIVFHDYAKAPLLFEVRGLPAKTGADDMNKFLGTSIGVVVHCEGGTVAVLGCVGAPVVALDEAGKEIRRWSGTGNHFANFIEAVRSRRKEDLHADILEGHLSSALSHTGNISYRLGTPAAPGAIQSAIRSDRDAAATFERMVEHLRANDVHLDATPVALGAMLTMNPKTERFVDNDRANSLLTRDYRAPFAVPETV